MKLPSDYLELLARGATILRTLSTRLRQIAAKCSDAPELWLSVRDFESLGTRLEELGELDWQHGFADMMITSVDFAVLDELLTPIAPVELSSDESRGIAQLNDFLLRYCRREFDLDDSAS